MVIQFYRVVTITYTLKSLYEWINSKQSIRIYELLNKNKESMNWKIFMEITSSSRSNSSELILPETPACLASFRNFFSRFLFSFSSRSNFSPLSPRSLLTPTPFFMKLNISKFNLTFILSVNFFFQLFIQNFFLHFYYFYYFTFDFKFHIHKHNNYAFLGTQLFYFISY